MKNRSNFHVIKALTLTISLSVGAAGFAQAGDQLRDHIGGGNLVTHLARSARLAQLYSALHGVGATMGRMDSYGWRTLDRKPTPHDFDAEMLEAHDNGITPIILLEYEGSYQTLNPPQPIGSYHDWFDAGQQMARRFRPDGEWARENGIVGWGATVFTLDEVRRLMDRWATIGEAQGTCSRALLVLTNLEVNR